MIVLRMVRFCLGYLIGSLAVSCAICFMGESWTNLGRLLLLWLPITLAYGILPVSILRCIHVAEFAGSLEICGVCVAAFPLISGLWPTYWFRFDVAIRLAAIQCSILVIAMFIRYIVYRQGGW